MSITIRGSGRQGTAASVLARVTGAGGGLVTRASLAAITRRVFDLSGDAPATPTSETALGIADCVYDTLQTGDDWTVDQRGYNFRDDLAAAVFAAGDHVYRVEYTFVDGDGGQYVVPAVIPAEAVLSAE